MTDLTALEEAAKKATRFSNGPWRWRNPGRDHPRGLTLISEQLEEVGDGWVRAVLYAEECDGGKAKIEGDDDAMEFIALANPSTILSLISTIRDLERERDEAFKAGMLRAAEIAEQRDTTNPFAPLDTPESWMRQQIATAIRAEAKGSGKQ